MGVAANGEGAEDLLEARERVVDERVVDVDVLKAQSPGGVGRGQGALDGALAFAELDGQAERLAGIFASERRRCGLLVRECSQLVCEALKLVGVEDRVLA